MIGGFGDAEVFSFHATKFFNTLEGGAIATNDDALAEKVRLVRNFGFSGYDRVSVLGTNGKMNEVSAAMGMAAIPRLGDFIANNRSHGTIYRRAVSGIPGVKMLDFPEGEKSNHQYSVLEIDDFGGVGRDRVQEALWAENVRARRYFYPGCHRMEPYRSNTPLAGWGLPETESLASRVLCLPTGGDLRDSTVERVAEFLRLILGSRELLTREIEP